MKTIDRIFSFQPIADKNSRILILGSMPGPESLKQKQYYAHPRNRFWKIIYSLYSQEPDQDYQRRKSFLLEKGIALWDVAKSCKRKGSPDSNIKDVIVNDLDSFLKTHPGINHVFFNGKKAHDIFKREFGFDRPGIVFTRLGSTSPAHIVSFDKLCCEWAVVRQASPQNK